MASTSQRGAVWQFAVDVGGTFTDCLARSPEGALLRCKVLSSGVVKGRATCSSSGTIVDSLRARDPEGFWRGYEFVQLESDGNVLARSRVVASRDGELTLEEPRSPAGAVIDYELRSGEEAPLLAVRNLLGLGLSEPIPQIAMRLGTTRGTNALLTRRGARVAYVTTLGFGDMLEIGYQDRPRLFELCIRKSPPLYERVVEIDERIDCAGNILKPLDINAARIALEHVREAGCEALAICLMNAYVNSVHEDQLFELSRGMGFTDVSVSSRVAPQIKLVARGDTTTVNAYLNPVLQSYVQRLQANLGDQSEVRILTSSGGLVRAEHFQGKDSILSGPAGGVVGFSRAAQAVGYERAIGFDMGGTSTDVSRFDGTWDLQYEIEKAGVRVVAPCLAIETIAAGGGSICHFDGVKLSVGPDSAGADPGPACYGRGGPLTVTDLNLVLGRLLPHHFPFPLHTAAVEQRLEQLTQQIRAAGGPDYTLWQLAEGLISIANVNMGRAIRSISIAKGYNPQDYLLVAFGGAAAQHACDVAAQLNMGAVLIHPDASLLSACGIAMADVVRFATRALYCPLDDLQSNCIAIFDELDQQARQLVEREGISADQINARWLLDVRYRGNDASLTVEGRTYEQFASAFQQEHERLYGFVFDQRPLEAVVARVEATGHASQQLRRSGEAAQKRSPETQDVQRTFLDGRWCELPVYQRTALQAGDELVGPAIVVDTHTTTLIAHGWNCSVLLQHELLLRPVHRQRPTLGILSSVADDTAVTAHVDPVALEVFHHAFAGIAEQMGATLRNTSSSVNVKERLDFSCAVFTASGDLVANAPHIPVHLGAMADTVKAVLAEHTPRPGDVFVTNDPYSGGSHLPDITVITPVFSQRDNHDAMPRLVFFTASRAHHAEIGGISPGSMPPFSRTLADEGVVIRQQKLFDEGRPCWEQVRELLSSGAHPSRAVESNLADLAAQVAANRQGARDLWELVERFSLPVVEAYMGHIQRAAHERIRQVLRNLPEGRRQRIDYLDDGSPIAVTIDIHDGRIDFDFSGTGPVLPGNLNANRSIVKAVILYCLRCLLDDPIPLNQGVLGPVTIHLPECLLNPPRRAAAEQCAAVAGGNVETSQRVTDVILGALDMAAASQGTMNNLSFGDATFGYYETICGGAGATPMGAGASAVHTHMTNTRLTDPEVFERRLPARLIEFSIRRGSGGRGRYAGGDGVVRRIELLRDVEVSIVSQRRGPYAPFGLEGGAAGQLGENELVRADGTRLELPAIARVMAAAGDMVTIKTPGGGGFGAPVTRSP